MADLSSIGSYLEATYPKEDGHKNFALIASRLSQLSRPSAAGIRCGVDVAGGDDSTGACANLGSLFAARAADRSREVALRIALGSSRRRILRQLLTEASASLIRRGCGRIADQRSAVAPFKHVAAFSPTWPFMCPRARMQMCTSAALALALVSGFLFGIVPVRQVLRGQSVWNCQSGIGGNDGAPGSTVRDVLLAVQIAICAVLVTASMVAVRGLMRSLHGSFGFELRNAMVAGVELKMGGYKRRQRERPLEQRMVGAMKEIPGVEQAALAQQSSAGGRRRLDDECL